MLSTRLKYSPTIQKGFKYAFSHQFSTRLDTVFVSKLTDIVGKDNISLNASVREQHGIDESVHSLEAKPPEVVIWPINTTQVSEAAKLCYNNNISMIPFGTGTGLEGGVQAMQGGVCFDTSRMDKIISVNTEDFDCMVEPGVRRKSLNEYIRDTGLMFPVDPGADASLGGMAATNASGTNAVRYGAMRENVLNLEVVLPDGRILHTAGKGTRSRKRSAGYNLTSLFVGSEGTLGIITKVTLRLHAVAETIVSATCSFKSINEAALTCMQTLQSSIHIARMELLDKNSIKATNSYFNKNLNEEPTLFLEFHGTPQEVNAQAKAVEEIALSNNGRGFKWSQSAEERNKLWAARHSLYYATLSLLPGGKAFSTDVCVPISKLSEIITEVSEDIQKAGIAATLFGHVGDGNFHTILLFDPNEKQNIEKIKDLSQLIGQRSLAKNGTCTGEHGIGLGKKDLLEQEMGIVGIEALKQVKKAFDPKGLMNPSKIFK